MFWQAALQSQWPLGSGPEALRVPICVSLRCFHTADASCSLNKEGLSSGGVPHSPTLSARASVRAAHLPWPAADKQGLPAVGWPFLLKGVSSGTCGRFYVETSGLNLRGRHRGAH